MIPLLSMPHFDKSAEHLAVGVTRQISSSHCVTLISSEKRIYQTCVKHEWTDSSVTMQPVN